MGIKTRAATLQEKRNADEKEGNVDGKEGCQMEGCSIVMELHAVDLWADDTSFQ